MIFIYYRLNMKKKATRHYAHVAHAMHHHHAKHLPKVFYHKGSLFPNIFWKSLFLLFLCSFMGYFLVHNLAPQTTDSVLVDNQKMLFSLEGSPEDWGVDSAVLNTHGAASNEFDFLFQSTGSTTDTTTDNSNTIDTSEPTTTTDNGLDSSTDVWVPVKVVSGTNVTWSISTWVLAPEITTPCSTPWGEKVQNKDFIIAYQQRSDVNSLCNVQKRYCSNGKLTWTYIQQSCKEDLKYTYTKVTPTAENDPNYVDPFLQPSEPSLSGAKFDTNGKITTSSSKPTDTWSNSGDPVVSSTGVYVTQITTPSASCTTAWGESVPVGHFVKAYKSSVGLIDMPCEVEIRLCTTAGLKWTFKQASCTYKNMTYSDYLLDKPENSDQANVIDMTNAVTSNSSNSTNGIWKWLTKYF